MEIDFLVEKLLIIINLLLFWKNSLEIVLFYCKSEVKRYNLLMDFNLEIEKMIIGLSMVIFAILNLPTGGDQINTGRLSWILNV